MKRFTPLAAIFVLLVLLFVFVVFPVSANPSWVSYNDPAHQTEDNDFVGESESTVYMQGIVTNTSTSHKIAYYDGNDAQVAIDTQPSTSLGILESELIFTSYPDSGAGLWHSVVYLATDTPATTYDVDDPDIKEDHSFDVDQTAIPEFPTVIAIIVAMGLSVGIYYWMRKRYHRQVATANAGR